MPKRTSLRSTLFLLTLTLAAAARPASAAASLSYEREELPGGAVLLVKESRQLPMVNIMVSLRAGTRYEPAEQAGLANLVAHLLTRGAGERSASDIEKMNDRLGGGVEVRAGRNFASATLKVLTRDLAEAIPLLADVLRRPTFPEAETEKTRRRILGTLEERKDRPGFLANVAFRKSLFGSRSAGRPVIGSEETVRKIAQADLVRFHKKRYGMQGTIFAFVGDITLKRARELVLAHFEGWNAEGGSVPEEELPALPKGMAVVKIDRPLAQTTVILGNRSLTRKDPDFYAARVVNYILGGGGFESRILNNLREEKGLVYSAYSNFAAGIYTGHWRLALQTKNRSANEAIAEAIAEVRRIQEKGITDQELDEAKAFITGNFATQFISSDRIARYILQVEQLGFPPDYAARYLERIRAVTKEQVHEAARKHIKLDEAVLTVVGNMGEAKLKY